MNANAVTRAVMKKLPFNKFSFGPVCFDNLMSSLNLNLFAAFFLADFGRILPKSAQKIENNL